MYLRFFLRTNANAWYGGANRLILPLRVQPKKSANAPLCVSNRHSLMRIRKLLTLYSIFYGVPFEISYRDPTPHCFSFYRDFTMPFESIYRDFIMPRLRQFTDILWCPVCVNLQTFYDAPFASIYRHFMMPRLRPFTDILWCPVCVHLQTFYKAPLPRLSFLFMWTAH